MRIFQLTSTGEHLARQFGAEASPSMKVIWFIRRQGGSASGEKIQQFAVSGEEYAIAIRKLKSVGAITEA